MKNIYKALANFQQSVPVILKNSEGYGYKFADLPQIFEIINPLLKKHKLGFSQPINGTQIKTVLFHIESGETIESITDIPQGVSLAKMNDFQVLGSAITYLRRYAISSMLGLVTDKETDATGERVPTPIKKAPEKTLKIDSEEWKALIKAVERGAELTLSQIQKKYKIYDEVKNQLEALNIF